MKTYGFDNIYNPECDLKVAYLGGSITRGVGASSSVGFSSRSMEYFKALKMAQGRLAEEINGGIGGTPSQLGMYRFPSKMLCEKPDILFIEFAVNDAGNYEGVSKYMEGIVRSCQRAEHVPVIIFLYSALGVIGNCENLEKCIEKMNEVAEYYGIAAVDFQKYIVDLIENGGEDIWNKDHPDTLTIDNVHPNDKGHQLYADYIIKCISDSPEAYLKKFKEQKEPLCEYEFKNPKLIPHDHSSVTYSKGFVNCKAYTAGTWTSKSFFEDKRTFSDGVHETQFSDENPESIEFKFKGRSVGIFYVRCYETPDDLLYTVFDEDGNIEASGTFGLKYLSGQMTCGVKIAEGLDDRVHRLVITTPKIVSVEAKGALYKRNRLSVGYFMIDGEAI